MSDNNGYTPEIDESKPVRDAFYDMAKALDHLERKPFAALTILCYMTDEENAAFFPYRIGDLSDEELRALLISSLYELECN